MKKNPAKYSVFYWLVLLIIVTGCGLKNNPIASTPAIDYKNLVKNMEASIINDGVALKWDFYNKDGIINDILIEKSEVGSVGNECKGCPRTYERIGRMFVKETPREDKIFKALNFTDKKVERDKTYNYRLMLCDADNLCIEASNTEINFK
ncbi:MAG: hypothetical protein A2031_07360 [Deltaproteobacteria bacterium RBG_19FT_COMBO_43_11]|nr:MAG: hypothetical protein A2031_07360 [Deltaproteobacteria bacterium RBG_19FT_COMBO_43_11]